MHPRVTSAYPLPVARALEAALGGGDGLHEKVMRLVDAVTFYLGAVSVGQYSQALFTGRIQPDPTLTRSLRSLRRVTPGQWLLWAARGLESTPGTEVKGLREWYLAKVGGDVAEAYGKVLGVMVETLSYTGEYGPQARVSPRLLLELVNQYRIIRGKRLEGQASLSHDKDVASEVLDGLRAILQLGSFLTEYDLYAPQRRQLLMGLEPTTPMPPIAAPMDAAASLLLYPPGEAPDYTKRPNLQAERAPLFPLDPLLVYEHCENCESYRVAALREVASGTALYKGLDPECGHDIKSRSGEAG